MLRVNMETSDLKKQMEKVAEQQKRETEIADRHGEELQIKLNQLSAAHAQTTAERDRVSSNPSLSMVVAS